jgi:hypothetical protein
VVPASVNKSCRSLPTLAAQIPSKPSNKLEKAAAAAAVKTVLDTQNKTQGVEISKRNNQLHLVSHTE